MIRLIASKDLSLAKLALFMLAAMPFTPAARAETTTQPEASISAGLKLARTLADEESQIDQAEKLLIRVAEQMVKTAPEFAVMVEQYPGIDKAWVNTMRPIVVAELIEGLPEYHAELAAIIESNMSEPHILETVKFYQSPTGQFVLQSVRDSLQYDKMSEEIAKEIEDPGVDISVEAQRGDKQVAVRKMQRSLSAEQRTVVARFELSPAGRSLVKLLPKKNELDIAWSNRPPTAKAEAQIAKAVPAAMDAYMTKIDDERAKGAKAP